MTGVAAETAPGDNAKRFYAQGIGHHGYQSVELEPGCFRMLFEFRPEKKGAAEPGKMGCGHVEISFFDTRAVAKGAVDVCKALRPPVFKERCGSRQNLPAHVRFALDKIHLCPGQRPSLRPWRSHICGLATPEDKR